MELVAFYSNTRSLKLIDKTNLVESYIVDLEKKGKSLRQQLYNTQISEHSIQDLKRVREITDKNLICRVNPQNTINPTELSKVINLGADEILIPMVKYGDEIQRVLELVQGKVKVSIMLETKESLYNIEEFEAMPLYRYYVGLNDLSIELNSKNLFKPLTEPYLKKIGGKTNKKFGLAGLTHPNLGSPIPCRTLMRVMKQHKCSYAVLRRSFYRDSSEYSFAEILSAISDTYSNIVDELSQDEILALRETSF